ncbi:hypothetical protein [Algoriphagus confluentis]|uniref:Lipoprotein n=1 Tax=Algoriphagus confluentis TaxID=1697556 RepID=A0ABQ6PIW8_9BACT|nr:hypothetical protein Aconfl_05320 [Algoriphagus confluentis]
MKKKYLLYVGLLMVLISCGKKQNNFKIEDNETIFLDQESQKIKLEFAGDGSGLTKLTLFNNEGESKITIDFFESEIPKGKVLGSNKQYFDFNSYILGPTNEKINDSLSLIKRNNLIKYYEYVLNGKILYSAIYENDKKTYNSLNLRLLDYEFNGSNQVELLLKNYFPFNGKLKFRYYNTNENIDFEMLEDNLYRVVYKTNEKKISKILLDIEIIPSELDSIIGSVFVQEIIVED